MKRIIRFVCILLAVSMLVPSTAFAAENVEPRVSNFFASQAAYIEELSTTKFEVWFEVTAVSGMDVLGAKTIKVQRSLDHSDWETVKTYSMDDYSSMTATNTAGHTGYVTYTGASSSYYYRAVVTFYAKNSSGIGEYTLATSYI